MKLKSLYQKVKKENWAIGQFNFSTLEQLKGIVLAGEKKHSPLILGTSEGESKFLGLEQAVALVGSMKKNLKVNIFLHLDHGKDPVYVKKAIDLGYDSVHFDGSRFSFKKNIKLTKEIVKYAHKRGVLVEGEFNALLGESNLKPKKQIKIQKKHLTNPDKAREFVLKTGVDSLAVSIGNIHGKYIKMPKLDFKRLEEIKKKTDCFLVLHGASGFSGFNLKKAIKIGVQKVNVNTQLRIVWRTELERSFKRSRHVKPYLILPSVIKKTELEVEKYLKIFNSINKLI